MGKKKKRRKRALDRVWEVAKRQYKYFSKDELATMIDSSVANTRLFALLLMLKQIKEGDPPDDYFDLAQRLISDSDNNCRWQSLFVVSELIETQPGLVWKIVSQYGDSKDDDMRTAIAVILLEHLLDYDFDKYFPKVKKEIQKGRHRFIDTLRLCSFDNSSGLNYKKAQSFLKNATRGLSKDKYTS